MYTRFSKLPDLFIEDYELILVTMTIIGSEIRRGRGLNVNCHSVARALVKFFPNFRVADGYVPKLSPKEYDEQHGARSVLAVEGEREPQLARYKRLYHSWLIWKDSNLIIDPWPVGGAYGFSPPVARLQDAFDIIYVEASFADMFVESRLEADTEEMRARIAEVLAELDPQKTTEQKTPP